MELLLFTFPKVCCNLPSSALRDISPVYERFTVKKTLSLILIPLLASALVACGGGSSAPVQVVTADPALPASPTMTAALVNTPFAFPSGVPSFGTTATTTLAFTSTATTPAFSISSEGKTATGSTTFGSCIFAVTSSTFPAGHALSLGQTVVVNPCNMNVNAAGATANGVGVTRSVALVLGAAASSGASVVVAVTAGGALTLNGNSVATVTLTPVSG